MLASSPLSEYAVPVLPVLDTMADQVEPLSADLSILYPLTPALPVFEGAYHDRLICDVDTVLAESPVGGGSRFTCAKALFASIPADDNSIEAKTSTNQRCFSLPLFNIFTTLYLKFISYVNMIKLFYKINTSETSLKLIPV